MISKTTIDLLAEEGMDISPDIEPGHIDKIFIPASNEEFLPDSKQKEEEKLTTEKKLGILDWASMDGQLRSYGFNKLDSLSLSLVDDDTRKSIANGDSEVDFDFRSESIPFAVKYNVAIALSYSEAIGMLSDLDNCEVYASSEIELIFLKHGRRIDHGLSNIRFGELPLEMKRELVWPMVQNLYRALTVRKASQIFPEGVSGKIAYDALMTTCENEQLAGHFSHLDAMKYSDYGMVYFSDPSDLEVKYHIALYSLNHIGEIKPKQSPEPESESEDTPQELEPTPEDEEQQTENFKKLEEEYISAFKRINKDKSLWSKINLGDIFEMGKDVMDAIKEEVRKFAQLKQEIIYRLGGRTEISIEEEELARIIQGQSPNFGFASKYLSMFFQPNDYYTILGLDSAKSPTAKDIKDAFKKQAKIYHPDKNSNDPDKAEKEKTFKIIIAAKDALLKQLNTGEKTPSSFRDDVSLTSYLGSLSKLFDGFVSENHMAQRRHRQAEVLEGAFRAKQDANEYSELNHNIHKNKEVFEMEMDEDFDQESIFDQEPTMEEEVAEAVDAVAGEPPADPEPTEKEYIGPYFEEMRILASMIDGWAGKDILIIGAGSEPDEYSMPVILARLGANVSAVDVNYRGPAEYEGCQYYRMSADRVEDLFSGEQFDIVISTAVFGVPFTNWAVREFGLNSFDEGLKDRIRELELEIIKKLLLLTKAGGIHFHHNKDLNPQSWNFGEEELKQMGCESAFRPEDLINPRETWILKK